MAMVMAVNEVDRPHVQKAMLIRSTILARITMEILRKMIVANRKRIMKNGMNLVLFNSILGSSGPIFKNKIAKLVFYENQLRFL